MSEADYLASVDTYLADKYFHENELIAQGEANEKERISKRKERGKSHD